MINPDNQNIKRDPDEEGRLFCPVCGAPCRGPLRLQRHLSKCPGNIRGAGDELKPLVASFSNDETNPVVIDDVELTPHCSKGGVLNSIVKDELDEFDELPSYQKRKRKYPPLSITITKHSCSDVMYPNSTTEHPMLNITKTNVTGSPNHQPLSTVTCCSAYPTSIGLSTSTISASTLQMTSIGPTHASLSQQTVEERESKFNSGVQITSTPTVVTSAALSIPLSSVLNSEPQSEEEVIDDDEPANTSMSSKKKQRRVYPELDVTVFTSPAPKIPFLPVSTNAESVAEAREISHTMQIAPNNNDEQQTSTSHLQQSLQLSICSQQLQVQQHISQRQLLDTNAEPVEGASMSMSGSIAAKKDIMMWNGFLNSIFRISSGLRENQTRVIQAFQEGRDCLHILRTGGGKSITFQLPSVIEPDRLVLVVSPISALIREQVMKLQQLGINAAQLGNDTDGNVEEMDDVQILYMNPECIFNGKEPTKNMVRLKDRHNSKMKIISLIAVDEAHKVFEWKSFRPAYGALLNIKTHFPSVPLHMHTATMTKHMQDLSIQQVLRNPVVLKFTTNRPNIYYRVLQYKTPSLTTAPDGSIRENWLNAAKQVVRETNNKPALVYISTAKSATALATSLLELGKVAAFYKGRTHQTVSDRETTQDNHLTGNLQYLVATSAYGVGIENPKEVNVLTMGMPSTCIEFIQQAGRVGRRGQDSVATLLVAPYKDIQKMQFLEAEIRKRHCQNNDVAEVKVETTELHEDFSKVMRFAWLPYAGLCLRQFMLKELDDHSDPISSHVMGCCDGCSIDQYCKNLPIGNAAENVLNMLVACSEMRELGIFAITQNKIYAYLKGNADKVAKNNEFLKNNIGEKLPNLKSFGVEKNGLSLKMMTIIFKQCVAKEWLESSYYTYRVNHARGSAPTTVHKVKLSKEGEKVMTTKVVDVPNAKHIDQAIEYVRRKEEEFYGVQEEQNENGPRRQGRNYKQPQRQIEEMLKNPCIPILAREQYIYLGYKHDCGKLLYTNDVVTTPGFPGNNDLDFLYKDVTLSKKSSLAVVTKTVSVNDGENVVDTELKFYKNPCRGVKKCSRCDFVCSRKLQINPCRKHGEVAELVENGSECPGCFAYVKPVDDNDKRRWLGFVNGPHNHRCPPISKPTAQLEAQVQTAMSRDPSLQTADLQKGHGLECMPMAISLAAANPTTMSSLRRKCMKKDSMEQTTSSTMISHFDRYVKKEIDCKDEIHQSSEEKMRVLEYTTPYFRELIQEAAFEGGIFMTPLMMKVMSEGEFFECDVTFPGLPCFKYLLNLCTFNSISLRYDVVTRALMTSITANAYKSIFKNTFELVTEKYSAFDNGNKIKGITVDFSLAQVKGLDNTLEDAMSKIKGCRSVHYMRNMDKVIAKVCKSEEEKKLFKRICKEIRDNPSQENVQELFSCLDGTMRLEELNDDIKDIFSESDRELNLYHWKSASSWVKWWSGDRVSIMLCEAYKTMNEDDWLTTSNHTNHVEALNRVSVSSKTRITLKAQLTHMYEEDKKRVYQHLADTDGCFRERRPSAQPTHSKKTVASDDKIGRYVMSSKSAPTTKKRRKSTKRNAAPKKYYAAKITSYDSNNDQYTATYENTGETFLIPSQISEDPEVMLLPEDYAPDSDTSFNLSHS